MRRRFELGLLFSLITLLVQIIAPISATYAMANADPLAALPICAHANDDGHVPSPAEHQKSCPCCTLLCSVSHSAFVAPSDVPTSIAAPKRLPRKIVFKTTAFIPTARPLLPRAQPRAPPLFS